MKKIILTLIIVFYIFTVNISIAQIVEKQANKKQLIKGKKVVTHNHKLHLKKVTPSIVKVNKVDVINQKNKTKKNLRKDKYNSKSVIKNQKRKNE